MSGVVGLLGFFIAWITDPVNWQGEGGITARLIEHLEYSGISLLVAAVLAVPLGLYTGHTGKGAYLVLNSANAARALPTLGLVVLAVTVTAGGLGPILVPLIALAIPPMLVNTFTGIRQVDADLKDAAQGMGMTGAQRLFRVEVPAGLPLILLGVRTAAIQVIATATVAAYAGLGGLGRYIIDGFARQEYETVVGGSVLVIALAMLTQSFFVLIRRIFVSPGIRGAGAS
ncbi:MAG: ABC transporter permease subunit [Streptosporangiales bacterium]|nr:ABC transporter permease subunit [Streptosporangiales bacterium]